MPRLPLGKTGDPKTSVTQQAERIPAESEGKGLDREKAEFLAKNQVENPQYNYVTPLFKFWVSRLLSDDKEKASQAFDLFQKACVGPIEYGGGSDWDEDRKSIKLFAHINYTTSSVSDTSLIQMQGKKEILAVINSAIKALDSFDTQESALRILNHFTMDVYNGKDAFWWRSEFSKSKLSGILQEKPPSEWIHLPE